MGKLLDSLNFNNPVVSNIYLYIIRVSTAAALYPPSISLPFFVIFYTFLTMYYSKHTKNKIVEANTKPTLV